MNERPSLTRGDLEANRLRDGLEQTTLRPLLLSEEELEASLGAVVESPHRDGDLWLFAYGSLIWNPLVEHTDRRLAAVHGFHRSFCLASRINRGTPDRPGLVLALDRGGRCTGVVYRIPAAAVENELRLLWRREMLLGSYAPRWVHATHGRETFRALGFVVNRARSGYVGRLPAEEVVSRLLGARGKLGTGIDYLRQTVDGLAASGIRDPYLLRIDALAQARLAEAEPHAARADLHA